MRSVARVLVAMVGCLTLALAGSARAKTGIEFFQTPSGNIGCAYDQSPPVNLRCDIRTGLMPKPSRPAWCELDWGDSLSLSPTGRTNLNCHGDTVFASPQGTKVLRYGTTWTGGPFTCTSRTTGLSCKNTADHGFLLRVKNWRLF